MKGYVINIEKKSLKNNNFRKVLYTAKNNQLVAMSLKPGEGIGSEVHELNQFIRVEKGMGKSVLKRRSCIRYIILRQIITTGLFIRQKQMQGKPLQ